MFQPLRYNYLPPIQLNVASIAVEQRFVPSGVAPDVSSDGSGAAGRRAEGHGEGPAAGVRHRQQGGLRDPGRIADATGRCGERVDGGVADASWTTDGTQLGFAEARVQSRHTGRCR